MTFALFNILKKAIFSNKSAFGLESLTQNKYPKISVILITYNNLELTKLCLDSIARNTDYPNYEVIIVDNASTDDTVNFVEEYRTHQENIVFIKNSDNRGFAAANNQGVFASSGEYIVFLNNDTIVTPGWMYRLYRHLVKNPQAGMVGPVTNAIGNEAKIDIDYKELTDIDRFAIQRARDFDGRSFEIRVLALYCSIIARDLYNRIGGLDERYQVGMFEDDDLALKINAVGLCCLCAEDVFIHHFHGASFKNLSDEENQRIFHENRKKFEEKWGLKWEPHKHRP